MIITKIIIIHIFNQGSAATNRIIAFAKNYYKLGKEVVLILGSNQDFEAPIIEGVSVYKCIAIKRELNREMARMAVHFYDDGSVIQIYGTPVLAWYLPKTKYNIVYECTEVPYYGKRITLNTWPKETIKKWLVKRTTGVMVISKALKRYFEAEGVKNIAIINMFVDASRFDGVVENAKEKYIAYCGKVSLHKDGVDDLIRAFRLFLDVHNDYSLWIIGGFENAETQIQLQQLVQSLHLENAVRFVGQVNPQEMPVLLKSAHILALARPNNKQAQYGFPTKLGEYLATGKPVVVTKVGEIGDFLIDGVNCRMAEPDNPSDFAEKLNWVADHYTEALAVGQKGKLLTETEFSSQVQCEKALEFMKSVIEL